MVVDDEDVTLAALLDGGVDHEVVAGPVQHRDGGARDRRTLLDGRSQMAPRRPVRPIASWTVATPWAAERLDVLGIRSAGW